MNASTNPRARRILVIDDNPAIHEDFRKILTGSAAAELEQLEAQFFERPTSTAENPVYHLEFASQGEQGLELVRAAHAASRPFALAFIDVRMPPGWDGVETAGRIWKETPDLPIVICTAYSDHSWENIIRQLGTSDNLLILKKPFDNVEVMQLAHALTEKWLLQQRVAERLENLGQTVQSRTLELLQANTRLREEIVEKKQAEQAACASEERFVQAFRLTPMPMVIRTLEDERYVDVNDAFLKMTGYEREEVIGHTVSDVKIWAEESACAKLMGLLRERKAVRDFECQMRGRNGDIRHVLLSAEMIELGNQPHVLIVGPDITERMALEAQLRQAQKLEAIGQLASGVAHDFNNILTVIHGHLSLMLSNQGLPQPVTHSLKQAVAAGERAAALTRQLLTFSRKQLVRPRVLEINHLFGQVREMFGRLIDESVVLDYDLSSKPIRLMADETSLVHLVINLVVNARDAMPKGGRILIRTELTQIDAGAALQNPKSRPGSFACLSVADNGCGMDAAILNKIFEPFFTTKDPGAGTGLGLATVYGTVQQHQGWIEVFSEVGRGSTFKIFLPEHSETTAAVAAPSAPAPAKGGKETILLVEDDAAVRDLDREVLERNGYRVLTARDGVDAWRIWQDHQSAIDLLFTDMVMPNGMSGQTLAEHLKNGNPRLKVIYTTGYNPENMNGSRPLQLRENFNFIQKPYEAAELARLVRNRLDAEEILA